jgi:hypothetical protein
VQNWVQLLNDSNVPLARIRNNKGVFMSKSIHIVINIEVSPVRMQQTLTQKLQKYLPSVFGILPGITSVTVEPGGHPNSLSVVLMTSNFSFAKAHKLAQIVSEDLEFNVFRRIRCDSIEITGYKLFEHTI